MLTFYWPEKFPEIGYEKGMKYVVKILIGEKYFITHVTSLSFLQKEIQNTWGKYHRVGIMEKNLYYPVIRQLARVDKKEVEFQVLYQDASGYNVLKFELGVFVEEFGKPNCLNEENVPYVPKTTNAKKGSNWLTPNEFLNYSKLIKQYEH